MEAVRRISDKQLPIVRTFGNHRKYRQSDVLCYAGIRIDQKDNDRKVVIYNRVSSQDQKQKGDLDRQKLRNYEYCTRNGYTVIESFEECSSGMNDNRPKLKRIIELAKERCYSKLIVEHKDRLTRFNFNLFVHFFNQMGIDVICVEEVLPINHLRTNWLKIYWGCYRVFLQRYMVAAATKINRDETRI